MKYYISLFQKIKEYYKTQSTNESEVPLICPSLRVYDNEEMNLLLPQLLINENLKGEAYLKKQDMSFQLNSIPSSDKFWDINPSNTLFNAYSKIINTAQIEAEQIEEIENFEANKILYDDKGKATKEKKAYDKYLLLFDKLITEWEEHVAKYSGLTTEDEKQVWLAKLNTILLRKEKAIVDHKLLGHKELIENAMRTINKLDGLDLFLANLMNSRNVMENTAKTGIQSLETFHDINFIPYDFMSNKNGWTKLSIEKKELDELYEIAKIHKDNFPEEIISIDYDEKNIIGIELEFSIVTLQRSWFSLSSLVSNFFKWTEAKSISDGETIHNDFLLPAYPKKMILIKNLKINIDPTLSAELVSNINQLISFGPIIMKSQLFVNSNNNVSFIKAVRNKETLRSSNVKYYNEKVKINKVEKLNTAVKPSVSTPNIAISATRTTMRTKPVFPEKKVLASKPILVNPVLFQPATIAPINTGNLTSIIVNIKDAITKQAIYKSEISIIGNNNAFFKEIESDKEGATELKLPIGNYKIIIIKDGYAAFEEELKIENQNTISKAYFLKPQSVNYDSFFLIGMICEKLPKIPR
ncbi:hypothetical protein FLCU109888_01135 [Flavobacterium cucumis]|uniref:Uncharacterized protein n=1 Tax=Flavobacterium cucumis TaxID=416016 RepID=A0A1M7ZTJ0_9FLAO|nr:hypothetical protein [Flavobacterium cucumis]SHO72214.1 hypothetical protein SAMN05443547_0541 [Flavobacterium cucumis]